ncbi:hypothetical protein [Rhizobium mongolense]|uniref:Uncharacterized protein n=1 Tax=Rhizobium mongolense TaxID=57676 RepID=A0A7W6RTG1_9HYPH|nr:hypothetical protein [Rhizobium mongolense]MBB4277771.1 hypothetical protein [Rhizobium mongolense]
MARLAPRALFFKDVEAWEYRSATRVAGFRGAFRARSAFPATI